MNNFFGFRLAAFALIAFGLVACSGNATYMSDGEQEQLQKYYQSSEQMHDKLLAQYTASGDTLSQELHLIYDALEPMQERMAGAHRQLLMRNQAQYRDNEQRMMSGKMGMHMQSHRVGEWYQQLQEVHQRLAQIHRRDAEQSWADMNEQMADKYRQMRAILPGLERPTEVPYNDKGNPEILNGQRLFVTNCASCHGTKGQGIKDVYPSVVDTKWVSGSPSIPMRILLHGLEGQLQVNGTEYSGYMPSFSARLSIAEMSAIVNFMRARSDSTLSPITQEQAIRIGQRYRSRTTPWTPDELQDP
ncbi:MAG: c-type cytochrome [Fodinibius sp.]|nr:c-type cytochrome [Fodinibius sp.]